MPGASSVISSFVPTQHSIPPVAAPVKTERKAGRVEPNQAEQTPLHRLKIKASRPSADEALRKRDKDNDAYFTRPGRASKPVVLREGSQEGSELDTDVDGRATKPVVLREGSQEGSELDTDVDGMYARGYSDRSDDRSDDEEEDDRFGRPRRRRRSSNKHRLKPGSQLPQWVKNQPSRAMVDTQESDERSLELDGLNQSQSSISSAGRRKRRRVRVNGSDRRSVSLTPPPPLDAALRREVALLVEKELLGGLRENADLSDESDPGSRGNTAQMASRVGELDLSEAQINGLHPDLAMHCRGARAHEVRAKAAQEEQRKAKEREERMRREREQFEQARKNKEAEAASKRQPFGEVIVLSDSDDNVQKISQHAASTQDAGSDSEVEMLFAPPPPSARTSRGAPALASKTPQIGVASGSAAPITSPASGSTPRRSSRQRNAAPTPREDGDSDAIEITQVRTQSSSVALSQSQSQARRRKEAMTASANSAAKQPPTPILQTQNEAAEGDEEERLTVNLRGSSDTSLTMSIRTKPSTKIGRLLDHALNTWGARFCPAADRSKARVVYDGETLSREDTVMGAGIEEDDMLDVRL
ncbi:Rad60/SUMO-like domain [Ceraceosorus bombacis]|uniref:Rad60/SUMO-like domain n=1 Tax=Ceraceosorus bombacis TaxID=401625 RepID=A0A0P1BNJ7_9BASI|nr:Rad60/SUMO-like domain [Ceraceosorus bombacis]